MSISASWSVELWEPMGGPITSISEASNREFVSSLVDGETFSFTLDVRNPAAALIKEVVSDIVVYRNSKKIYRGRIQAGDINKDASSQTVNVSSVGYKHLLSKRFLRPTDDIVKGPSVVRDLEAHAWECILITQSRGADWSMGITRGTSQSTGTTLAKLFEPGTSVKDAIDVLANTASAVDAQSYFEWWIDSDLIFNVAPGQRGRINPTFLIDYGGSALSFGSRLDPSSYANHFEVQGTGTLRASVDSSDLGRWPGCVYEEYISESNLESTLAVDNKAFYLATYHGQLDFLRSYTIELSPAAWTGPSEMWIGDYVILDLGSGGVKTESLRVTDMVISVDETGMERIGVSVGYVPSLRYRDLHRLSNFLKDFRTRGIQERAKHNIKLRDQLWAAYNSARKQYGMKHAITQAALRQFYDMKRHIANAAQTNSAYDKIISNK